jgi:hypothetical protein
VPSYWKLCIPNVSVIVCTEIEAFKIVNEAPEQYRLGLSQCLQKARRIHCEEISWATDLVSVTRHVEDPMLFAAGTEWKNKVSAMNKTQLWDELRAHDWSYEYADNRDVFNRGAGRKLFLQEQLTIRAVHSIGKASTRRDSIR